MIEDSATLEDPAVFAALYEAWSAEVGRWARHRLWDAAEAEDVAQEVFLRAWSGARRFDPERGTVGPWLYGITRHVCADRLRRAGRSRVPLAHNAPGHVAGADEFAERAVEAEATRVAVTRLGPAHREIIELCFFSELSHAEAAHRLGIPTGTVKSRSHHALRRLRGILHAAERGAIVVA